MYNQAEITLITFFQEKIDDVADDKIDFSIESESSIKHHQNVMEKIREFVSNVRKFAAILINIFRNQIKILIRSRIEYCKETF